MAHLSNQFTGDEMDIAANVNATRFPWTLDVSTHQHNLLGYQRIGASALLIVIAIVGMAGNSLVVLSVALSQKLQTTSNIFVVTLAATDFFTAFNQIIHFGVLLGPAGSRGLQRACALVGALNVLLVGYSIGIMMLIAVYRLHVVTNNQPNGSRHLNKKVTASIVATFGLPSLIGGFTSWIEGTKFGLGWNGMCSYTNGNYLDMLLGLIMLVYLIIMFFCYLKICLHLRSHLHRIAHIRESEAPARVCSERANLPSVSSIALEPTGSHLPPDRCRIPIQLRPVQSEIRSVGTTEAEMIKNNRCCVKWKDEKNVTVNMFLVVVAFVVCITPSMCLLFVPGTQKESWLAFCVMLSNCCWNPVIYASKHPHFRRTFRCIVQGKFSEIEEPVSWLRLRLQNR